MKTTIKTLLIAATAFGLSFCAMKSANDAGPADAKTATVTTEGDAPKEKEHTCDDSCNH